MKERFWKVPVSMLRTLLSNPSACMYRLPGSHGEIPQVLALQSCRSPRRNFQYSGGLPALPAMAVTSHFSSTELNYLRLYPKLGHLVGRWFHLQKPKRITSLTIHTGGCSDALWIKQKGMPSGACSATMNPGIP